MESTEQDKIDKPQTGSAASDNSPPPVTPPPVKPPPVKPAAGKATPPPGKGGGKGLAALALLVGLAALGLQGWQWYQNSLQAEGQSSALDAQLAVVQAEQDRLSRSLDARLQGLPEASDWQQFQRLNADLQRSQQALSQRLDTLQGDARADWKLAEAEYLLRLASLRLLAAQDVTSATELLAAVDGILKAQPDTGVFAVREQLAQYRAELDNLPRLDRAGVFLRLGALREQVGRLVLLPVPVFDPDEVTVEEEFEDRLARRTRGERMLMRLERYVRVDFQRGKVITPLLDEAEMQRVRRTLQLTMEQAQWAALRGEPEVYLASLQQADALLRQFFELDNPQVRVMQEQLQSLTEQQVSLTAPDLAPLQQTLTAYIQSRRSLPAVSEEPSP
ncbi:MAG: heme biosynthesis operon protein HemX [Gammaproteobacteria bacterium HGW-Gammaproteobacteria-11]|nr:MAG: heme biosynthesis operon protein HemX [Gammaproteobacteria bacterium HGW-Gammaproteobacteria-11]